MGQKDNNSLPLKKAMSKKEYELKNENPFCTQPTILVAFTKGFFFETCSWNYIYYCHALLKNKKEHTHMHHILCITVLLHSCLPVVHRKIWRSLVYISLSLGECQFCILKLLCLCKVFHLISKNTTFSCTLVWRLIFPPVSS